jgi:hypothetical protein
MKTTINVWSIYAFIDARKPVETLWKPQSHSTEDEEEPEEIQKSAVSSEESNGSKKDDHDLNDQNLKPQQHKSKFDKHLKEKTV